RRVPPNSLILPRLQNTISYPTYSSPSAPVVSSVVQELNFQDKPESVDEVRLTALVEKVVAKAVTAALSTHQVTSIAQPIAQRDNRQCYYCGRLGHVERFCRTRQRDRRNGIFTSNRSSSPRYQQYNSSIYSLTIWVRHVSICTCYYF